jgi:hypothetical protein
LKLTAPFLEHHIYVAGAQKLPPAAEQRYSVEGTVFLFKLLSSSSSYCRPNHIPGKRHFRLVIAGVQINGLVISLEMLCALTERE